MYRIELSWLEMFNACMVGVARRLASMRAELDPNKHAEVSNFQTDIEGAIAEACFAKHYGMYWAAPINNWKGPDVGAWQVRSTSYENGHLIIRPNDKVLSERFVLATTKGFGATLVGWFTAGEARVEKYWRTDAWWVPQSELHHLGDTLEQSASLHDWKPPEQILIKCEGPEADLWRRHWRATGQAEPFAVHGGKFFVVPSATPPAVA